MKKMLISLVAVLMVAAMLVPAPSAHAQLGDLFGNTLTFEEGTTVQFPAGWRPFVRSNGFTFLATEDTQILFSLNPPSSFEDYEVADGDLAGFLVESFGPLTNSETLDPAAITPLKLGIYDAVQSITTTSDEFGGIEHWVFITQLNNGIVFYISVINLTGDVLAEPDAVMTILNSFDDSQSTYTPGSLDLSRPELDQTYTLLSGATINYPAGWEIETHLEADADYELSIFNDLTSLVVDSLGVGAFADAGVPDGDLRGLLAEAFIPLSDTVTFDPTQARAFNLDDSDGLRYDYVDVDTAGIEFSRTVIVTTLSSGEVYYLAIVPQADFAIAEMPIALQILASLVAPEDSTGTAPTTSDFYTFDDGWRLTWDTAIWSYFEEDGYLYLDSELTSLLFDKYLSTIYSESNVAEGDNLGLMRQLFYSNDKTITFEDANFQAITIGNFTGGRYDFVDHRSDGSEFEHKFLLVQMPDNSVALFSIIAWEGFAITEMDAVLELAASWTTVE